MNEKILITNDQGEEKEFDVLFTFESKDTGKKYVTYTDYTKDYKGNINCYSGYYEGNVLLPVYTEKEKAFINETLKTLTETINYKYKSTDEN